MFKRLIVGLLLGMVLGGIGAAVLVQGLGVVSFVDHGAIAFLSAAILGAVTGLVAGKPIWSGDGKIEAGIKAFFGAVIALGAMYVLKRWVTVPVDLTALKAGKGALGTLPAATLPIIAALLAGGFELDNTGGSGDAEKKEDGKAPASAKKVRVKDDEAPAATAEEEEEAEPPAEKKRR